MRRRPRGFTLVELLVVIGIIALLMALLLPTLGVVRQRAKASACMNNLRQIGNATQIYLSEGKDFYPPAYWGWSQSSPPWNPGTPPPGYDAALVPARKWWHNNAAFRSGMGVTTGNPEGGRYPKGLACPDARLSEERITRDGITLHNSYGMNYTQLPALAAAGFPSYWQAWKRNRVVLPAEKIWFVDGTSEGVNVFSGATTGKPNSTLTYFHAYYGGERHEGPDWGGAVAFRHLKGSNLLFFDGHVEWKPMSMLAYDPGKKDETGMNLRQWQPTTR